MSILELLVVIVGAVLASWLIGHVRDDWGRWILRIAVIAFLVLWLLTRFHVSSWLASVRI